MRKNNFPDPMLILIMRIDVGHINIQPTPNFNWKISVGLINSFLRKLMWVIFLFVRLISYN